MMLWVAVFVHRVVSRSLFWIVKASLTVVLGAVRAPIRTLQIKEAASCVQLAARREHRVPQSVASAPWALLARRLRALRAAAVAMVRAGPQRQGGTETILLLEHTVAYVLGLRGRPSLEQKAGSKT